MNPLELNVLHGGCLDHEVHCSEQILLYSLLERLDIGIHVDLVMLVLLWLKMDVCCDSRNMCHCQNQLSSLILYHQKIRTDVNHSFSDIDLYQLTITPLSDNACAAQIDWMRPYFSMMLAIALLCMLVTLYHMVIGPHIGGRTLQLWVKVIIESLLLFTVVLVAYVLSNMHTVCSLLGVIIITVSCSSMHSFSTCSYVIARAWHLF